MIFVDTGFLVALFNKRDRDHPRLLEVFRTYQSNSLPDLLLTRDHVIFETITYLVKKTSHERAIFVGERLHSGKLARIHQASFDDQVATFEYLKRHRDKTYSAVDCLSFVVMEKHGIAEALALDDDFTPRFAARPGPRPQ